MAHAPAKTWRDDDLLPFLRRLLLAVGVLLLVGLAFLLREILLAAFATVLVAIILVSGARLVSRVTKLGPRLSLTLASIVIIGGTVTALFLLWPFVQSQIPVLIDRVVESLNQLERSLGIRLPDSMQEIAESIAGMADRVWSFLTTTVGMLVGAVSGLVLVVAAGVFVSAEPARYRDGLVLFFPRSWHKRVRVLLDKLGDGLGKWLKAQLVAMLVVGVLTGLGTWAIGLPSPLALGLFAGLGEFVPIIGPLIALVPAALVAIGEGGPVIWWTIGLYILVQQIEGNLLTPLLQERMASVPPVFLLFAIASFGLMFGVVGIILAAPLSVVVYILVRELYMTDVLGEEKQLNGNNGKKKRA